MYRRLMSLLIVCALMACFGAMLPAPASASVHADMPTTMAPGCTHHYDTHMTCHDCPICAGVDLPRMATWDDRGAMPADTLRPAAPVVAMAGLRPAGLDRPPRRQG
jgi:hypothetical protein